MDLLNYLLHADEYIQIAIGQLGGFSYLILFAIIFAETGLVIVPFLPGDSLLFAAGTLAGGGFLNILILVPTMIAAAIIGDAVNYWLGYHFGKRAFTKANAKIFRPASLEKTQAFYDKYGGKTIIIARFLPIIRTFAPFAAGISHMNYRVFFAYNVAGAIIWVGSLTIAGYFFGSIPIVKQNFEYAVLAVIILSTIPAVIEFVRHKRSQTKTVTKYDSNVTPPDFPL